MISVEVPDTDLHHHRVPGCQGRSELPRLIPEPHTKAYEDFQPQFMETSHVLRSQHVSSSVHQSFNESGLCRLTGSDPHPIKVCRDGGVCAHLHEDGEVEGHDLAHDTQRLVQRVREVLAVHGDGLER